MPRSSNEQSGVPEWPAGLLFAGLFFYLWLGLGPLLLFYGFGVFTAAPVFIRDAAFLRSAWSAPGEPIRALAALAAAGYGCPWLGALAMVTAMAIPFLGLRCLLTDLRLKSFVDLAWGPPLLGLMLFNRCDDAVPDLLGLGLALWTAVLFLRRAPRRPAVRMGVFFLCSVCLYTLAGGWVFALTAVLCCAALHLERNTARAILQAGLAAAGVVLVGRGLFFLETDAMWLTGTPWRPGAGANYAPLSHHLRLVLFLYAPAAVLPACLGDLIRSRAGAWITGRQSVTGSKVGPVQAQPANRSWRRTVLRWSLVTGVLLLGLVASRSEIRYERLLHYHAALRNWDQVLQAAERMQGRVPFTRPGLFDINRALAHRRKLGDRLCAYPQAGSQSLFLSHPDMAKRVQFAKLLELYLDLGDWHAAERNAYELFEYGESGLFALDAMARIHAAKGQHDIAAMVTQRLKKHAGWRHYIRLWQTPEHPGIRAGDGTGVAGQAPGRTTDYINYGVAFESLLVRLLRDHPQNGLAFEYLLACGLLERQHAKVIQYLPALRSLGYQQLPRHVSEALFVQALLTRTQVNAQGWALDAGVREQIQAAMATVQQAGTDSQAAFRQLAPRMGDTYTFYCLFGVCGVQ
jgi:hypothetical protein